MLGLKFISWVSLLAATVLKDMYLYIQYVQPHCVGTVLGKVGGEFSISTKNFEGSMYIGIWLASSLLTMTLPLSLYAACLEVETV